METLIEGIVGMGQEPGRLVMMLIGGLLLYLGIKKEYEPTLLVPMGLGTILVNFPDSGVLSAGGEPGAFQILFDAGIKTELFPLLLFIGIGAMIDFGPLLQNPFMLLFGAAAQFGIFFTVILAILLGFDLNDAASIGIIGAADGPTSIFVANTLNSQYMGAIMVAAYSYMALVPIIQPVAIKAVTTKKERQIRMTYRAGEFGEYSFGLVDFREHALRGLLESRHTLGHLLRLNRVYYGFGGRRPFCQIVESLSKRKNQSHGGGSRNFGFSHVQSGDSKDGHGSRSAKLYFNARSRSQCF